MAEKKVIKKKVRYQVEKHMKDAETGKLTVVIINNSVSEVFETSNQNLAIATAEMLNVNSDSGHLYFVRTIG